MQNKDEESNAQRPMTPTHTEWGEIPEDHFGYASEEERLEKRGLEDWELVEKIPESQKRVPKWFYGIILGVLIVAFGLSLPFWGDRPDHPRPWFTMGHLYAVIYLLVAGSLVYFMSNLYGSEHGGRLDSDHTDDDIDMPGFGGDSANKKEDHGKP